MSRIVLVLAVVFLLVPLCPADTTTTRPFPGIALETVTWSEPPMRFFIATIDLDNPRIHVKVSRGGSDPAITPPWEVTLMPVSKIAQRDGLAIAVNGNLFQAKDYQSIMGHKLPYFEGNWARASGWAMSDGAAYSTAPADRPFPSLVVNDRNEIRIGSLDHLPADARQVVSGVWQIVTNGRNNTGNDIPVVEGTAAPAPHTVAGVDRDGKKLILFVVDGRRPDYSVGMQMHQMGDQLVSRGVWNAILLDGGGSSTLVLRDSGGKVNLVNRPSDGHDFPMGVSVERCVANALGIIIDPPGTPDARPTQP
jgi:hypothetical protein